MNPTVVTFIAFVVAILILMWGAIELGSRYTRSRKKVNTKTINTWITLKPRVSDTFEDPTSLPEKDAEESSELNPHARAKQNGHFSQSKKPL